MRGGDGGFRAGEVEVEDRFAADKGLRRTRLELGERCVVLQLGRRSDSCGKHCEGVVECDEVRVVMTMEALKMG